MANPIEITVELRGADEAIAAIRQIDPILPTGEVRARLDAALGFLECRTRANLAEPDEWRPLNIRVLQRVLEEA